MDFIIKKLFLLWTRHTTGFCRVLFLLMFPAAFLEYFSSVFSCFLLILWLILKTGYEEKWDKNEEEGEGNVKE